MRRRAVASPVSIAVFTSKWCRSSKFSAHGLGSRGPASKLKHRASDAVLGEGGACKEDTKVKALGENWQALLLPIAILVGAVLVALVAHRVVFVLAKRMSSRRKGSIIEESLIRHGERPTRWIFPLLALVLALPTLPFRSGVLWALEHAVGLGLILSIGWLFILLADVFGDAVYPQYRVDVSDNLAARRVRTQIHVLRRIFIVVVVIVTAAVMLMTFPAIHELGTSLLASAGLAGHRRHGHEADAFEPVSGTADRAHPADPYWSRENLGGLKKLKPPMSLFAPVTCAALWCPSPTSLKTRSRIGLARQPIS